MQSPFVDVKDVAAYLGINKELVYRLCDPKKTPDPLPHFRLGKKMKFRIDAALEAWIARRFLQSQGGLPIDRSIKDNPA
jgi:predicted DNA-binding transcriptional regulator AlpA